MPDGDLFPLVVVVPDEAVGGDQVPGMKFSLFASADDGAALSLSAASDSSAIVWNIRNYLKNNRVL
jgi:hypothetical protein